MEHDILYFVSYLPKWWASGPEGSSPQSQAVTSVTSDLMNSVLGDVLTLIQKHIGVAEAPWMNRIASKCLLRVLWV